MLENQRQIMESQQMMLENQKQLMDNNTAIIGETRNVIKIQNGILQKIAGFSVQLEDAVVQITGMRSTDNNVLYLKDSKGLQGNPFSIKAIDSRMELDAFEKSLSDKTYKNNLKQTYAVISSKGRKGVDCAYVLVDMIFTRNFICQCSWSGGSRGDDLKVPLKGYRHVLSFFWELVNFWDEAFTLTDNENFFKSFLKNSIKRKLAKCERASTSRKRSNQSKPSQGDFKETSTSEKEINYVGNTAEESTKMNKNKTYPEEGEGESQNTETEKEEQIGTEDKKNCEANEPKSDNAKEGKNDIIQNVEELFENQ